jgi:hypothetical protein
MIRRRLKVEVPVSIFRTRRASSTSDADLRQPVSAADPDHIEGVTLETFAAFVARVGEPGVTASDHEGIALVLGFPAGRFDLIRNAWLTRIYSSPALGKEFGHRLDDARGRLSA